MKRTFLAMFMATLLADAFGGRVLGEETVALYDNLVLESLPIGADFPDFSDERFAQPFWTGDSDNVSAVTIDFNGRFGNATGQVSIEIWDDDGTGFPGKRVGVVGTLDVDILPDGNVRTSGKQIPADKLVSLDIGDPSDQLDASMSLDPEESFNYAWKADLLERALQEVKESYVKRGMENHWHLFNGRVIHPVL